MKFVLPEDEVRKAIRLDHASAETRLREDLAMSKYRDDIDANEKAVLAAELEVSNRRQWFRYLQWQADNLQENQIKNSTATYQMVLDYFGDEPLSLEALIECHSRIPGVERETRDEAKEALLRRYLGLVPGSESMKTSLLSRMRYKSNLEIEEAISLLESSRDIRKLPINEIRKLVKPAHPAPDELPAHYTKSSLLALDGKSLRAVILRYGSLAVTQRINQR